MTTSFAATRAGNVISSSGMSQETLDSMTNILAEQVWIGGYLKDIRSKTKVIQDVNPKEPITLDMLPVWNFDGSSTNQAPGNDSEILIVPRKIYKDPFRGGPHILVLCDTFLGSDPSQPSITNFRETCNKLMEKVKESKPWFGIEQEQTLMSCSESSVNTWPLGWPSNGQPMPQGPFQTGVGAELSFGRAIANSHLRACCQAGVRISGLNAEVMPGQWEFQVGPCEGIQMGDDLQMARQLLLRVAEDYSVAVSFDPKPIKGDWNGAGCHTNYSTEETRIEGGFEKIKEMLSLMETTHSKHIRVYGAKNNERLTGHHETADMSKFTWGVANRQASSRVPRETERYGKGYFEDRRPASNIDPYLVTACMVDTTLLKGGLEGTVEYRQLIARMERDTPELLMDITNLK